MYLQRGTPGKFLKAVIRHRSVRRPAATPYRAGPRSVVWTIRGVWDPESQTFGSPPRSAVAAPVVWLRGGSDGRPSEPSLTDHDDDHEHDHVCKGVPFLSCGLFTGVPVGFFQSHSKDRLQKVIVYLFMATVLDEPV